MSETRCHTCVWIYERVCRALAAPIPDDQPTLEAIRKAIESETQPTPPAEGAAPDRRIPADPDPNCPYCKGSGEAPNAQFRCHCRWRHIGIPREVTNIYDAVDSPAERPACEGETAARELALVREAANDPTLSDAAVRVIARGLREPTADDIAWARKELSLRPEDEIPEGHRCSGCGHRWDGDLKRLVLNLQAHAREHGWQDTDEPIAALLAWQPSPSAPPSTPEPRQQLDPDMPAQEIRLHLGELTPRELRVARAAIRWANSSAEPPSAPPEGLSAGGSRQAAITSRVERIVKLAGATCKREARRQARELETLAFAEGVDCGREDAGNDTIAALEAENQQLRELMSEFGVPDAHTLQHWLEDHQRWHRQLVTGELVERRELTRLEAENQQLRAQVARGKEEA